MRPQTRVRPTVDTLESRELLSSLPVVPSPAGIHVEMESGKRPSATGDSSIGTLQGTISLGYAQEEAGSSSLEGTVYQYGIFTTGTGTVKPFGRVSIGGDSSSSSGITGTFFETYHVESPPTSLEGPVTGAINLVNARGRVIGSITLEGDSWGQFAFQERRSGTQYSIGSSYFGTHSRVIAKGTGMLTFPDGDPVLGYNTGTGSGTGVAVPFTITL